MAATKSKVILGSFISRSGYKLVFRNQQRLSIIDYPFRRPRQVGTYDKLMVSQTVSYPFPKAKDIALSAVDAFLKSVEEIFTSLRNDHHYRFPTVTSSSHYDPERNVFVSENRKRKNEEDEEYEDAVLRVLVSRRIWRK